MNKYMLFCAAARASREWKHNHYDALNVPDQGRVLGAMYRRHAQYRGGSNASHDKCHAMRSIGIYTKETAQAAPEDVIEAMMTFRNYVCKTSGFVPICLRHGDLEILDDLTLFALRSGDGRILGTIAFNKPDKAGRLEVEYVCSKQGCGYGRELMTQFIAWLHHGSHHRLRDLPPPPTFTSITLTSVPDALGFYHKMGFVTHEEDNGLELLLVYKPKPTDAVMPHK